MPYRQIVGVGHDGRVVIDDPDPSLLSAHVALTTSAHGIGGEWFETYLQRGVSRAGITPGEAGYFFEEFTDTSRWRLQGGTVNLTAVTTMTGGVAELVCAGGDSGIYRNGDATYRRATIATGGGRLYIAGRVRLAVIGNDSLFRMGLDDWTGTQGIFTGYNGSTDATHFFMVIDDAVHPAEAVVSTVRADDLLFHDIECWSDGSLYYLAVDNETPVVLTPAASVLTNPMYPRFDALSSGFTDITPQWDKLLYVFPQAA